MLEKEEERIGPHHLPMVSVSTSLADQLDAKEGDLLYLSDRRWWLGGLNSTHVILGEIVEGSSQPVVMMGESDYQKVVSPKRLTCPVLVEKLY